MSLNPDIIQFVTDTTARINLYYPVTLQQRLILDKNTGLVFWDVDRVRYRVNTTPKIAHTVTQGSDALVTGDAVAVYVQGIAGDLLQQITQSTISVDTSLSDVSTNPVQNKAVKSGIDLALQGAREYTQSAVSSAVSSSTALLRGIISSASSSVLSGAKLYTDSRYTSLSSSYIPLSSVVSMVQLNDTHIPTGGAVYEFVQSAIEDIGGGLSEHVPQVLAGLSDVTILHPVDDQVLAYNSNTSKWLNKTIQQGTARISWTVYTDGN